MSSSGWRTEEEENEGSDDEEEEEPETRTDKIIFLIDAREPMKEKNSQEEVLLRNCLQVLVEVMKSKVVADDKSLIGLTIFGAAKKDPASTVEGLHVVFPLQIPNAANIRKVQEYIDNAQRFAADIGCQAAGGYCPLREALWSCSQDFALNKATKQNADFTRIWLFTNDDSPNAGNPEEQARTVQVAKDCAQTGIEIALWHMNRAGRPPFDPKKYYHTILLPLANATDDDLDSLQSRIQAAGDDPFDLMLCTVRRKQYKKRKLRSMFVSLGGKALGFAVNLYRLINIAKKAQYKWLYAKNNVPLVVSSKYIDGETGEALDDSSIMTYLEVSGSKVPITSAEMKAIKSCSAASEAAAEEVVEPDIKLLYCAPVDQLKPEQNVESSYFLVPDEATTVGSISIFTAFLVELTKRNLMAVVRFKRTKNSVPRLAAMLPQLEIRDEDDNQVQAPGFNVIVMPYMEEIRRNVGAPTAEVVAAASDPSSDVTASAIQLIRKAQLDPSFVYYQSIESPVLQQFHSVLQAVALSLDAAEYAPKPDQLHPDPEGQADYAPEAFAFKDATGLVDAVEGESAPKKRAAPSKSAAATKKSKAAGGDDGAGAGAGSGGGDFASKSVAELKELCRSFGLPVSGTKAVLIGRLQDASC